MTDLVTRLRQRLGDAWALNDEAADEIERLTDEVRSAHFDGYMAGVGDSEDYDHDPVKMELEAWKDRAALEDDDGLQDL